MKKTLILILALAVALAAVVGFVFTSPAAQDALFGRLVRTVLGSAPEPPDGLRVVVCGSASPLGNVPERAQACIAILTAEHFFLIDVGARSPLRMAQARLPLGRLNGVLLTHFHSDHIASLPDVNLASWVQGRRESLKVYGPPGVATVIEGFNQAYQLDRGYRVEHHGEALLPSKAGPMTASTTPLQGVVWQDDQLTITVFPVDHSPVAPAVGYRVDYRGRSVVVSGDSIATQTLFTAAQDADLLLHDALSRTLLDPMIAAATELKLSALSAIMTDVIDYHADSLSLEERAAQAGVRQLALYHLVPAPANALAEQMFARGLAPDTLIVKDLHTFDLPADSQQIRISAP